MEFFKQQSSKNSKFSTIFGNSAQNNITMKTIYTLIIGLLVLTSCKTSFRISVQTPPKVKLPFEVTRLGAVNNVTKENSPEKVIVEIMASQSINGNVVAAENAPAGLFRGLEKSGYLSAETIPPTPLTLGGAPNWPFIDSLCAARQLHGIIETSSVTTISPVGGTVLASATGQNSSRLQGTMFTNVYIANTHESIEQLQINRYYNIPLSGGTSIVSILNDVQRKQQYYKALGYELGYGTGMLFYANWVWVDRKYYTKGSKSLKRARTMIKAGNWDIAEKQLLQDVDHHKEKIRGRILFNLALIKEGQGNLDEAIQYAEKAALECGDKLANPYLVQLRRRQNQLQDM